MATKKPKGSPPPQEAAPSSTQIPRTAREVRVKHLKKKRGQSRSVARALACEKFIRTEHWIQVDDNLEPVTDPKTGEVRTHTQTQLYVCRGRDCPCARCQAITTQRSIRDTVEKIRLGWDHAEKTGRSVFSVTISPPYNKSSFRRALVDVRCFRERLTKSIVFKRLIPGGIWRIEIKYPVHPHLHLTVEAEPDVDVWLPKLRALVNAKAGSRVPRA